MGRTPARANPSFWDEKRETSNVWLSIADLLKAEDNVVVDSKEYVSDKGAKICKLVAKGTLLVSFKLTLGRLAFAGRDLFTNEAIAALTIFNERELSKEFLFYFLHFFDWVGAAENDVKLKGMTLNKAKLKEMRFTSRRRSPNSSGSSACWTKRLRASPPPKPTPKRTSKTPAPSSKATSNPSSPSAARGGWRNARRCCAIRERRRGKTIPTETNMFKPAIPCINAGHDSD